MRRVCTPSTARRTRGCSSDWARLRTTARFYVGKAEDSLRSRDVRTHFGDGRTGSSTVRRSFAALLRERLDLRAQPRNPAKPERFANYGLGEAGDARLTEWMRAHLTLGVWPKVSGAVMREVESAVLAEWQPPINLDGVDTPWKPILSRKGAAMAQEARASAERGHSAR